jgi:hypothetical protein
LQAWQAKIGIVGAFSNNILLDERPNKHGQNKKRNYKPKQKNNYGNEKPKQQ